ncbi:MAG: hypothetical protein WCB10_16830 [Steroidobacteraceae bacterium]
MRLLLEAGIDASHAGEFELDHVIPLALGGDARALSNLALQVLQEARVKDALEVQLQHAVCPGQISLTVRSGASPRIGSFALPTARNVHARLGKSTAGRTEFWRDFPYRFRTVTPASI